VDDILQTSPAVQMPKRQNITKPPEGAAIVGRQSLGLFEKAVVELGNEARPDWRFRLHVIMISQITLMATSISSLR